MNAKLALAVFSMVFISGCVGGFPGFRFGSAGTTIEAPDDVLLIKNAQVVPTPPIQARSTFDLTFLVENTGDAETGKEAENVTVYGYDWGRCHNTTPASNPGLVGIPGQPTTIYPGGGASLIEWTFQAPSNDELGRVQGVCTIRYKVGYDFTAFTVTDLSIIDEDRLREANRAGETITVTPVTSKSKGPLKIAIDVGADQPARESTSTNPSVVPINIRIDDRGAGFIEGRGIGAGKLKVEFPPDFEGKVNCDSNSWNNPTSRTPTNKNVLPFIKKQTPPLRCDITAPDVADLKTFAIRAEMDYRYELFDETDVEIQPTVVSVSG